jgi:methylglyoxal synthase
MTSAIFLMRSIRETKTDPKIKANRKMRNISKMPKMINQITPKIYILSTKTSKWKNRSKISDLRMRVWKIQ